MLRIVFATVRLHVSSTNLFQIPVIITAALNYDYQSIFRLESFDIVYLGDYFWANWAVCTMYSSFVDSVVSGVTNQSLSDLYFLHHSSGYNAVFSSRSSMGCQHSHLC
jgi:hypothetical protein